MALLKPPPVRPLSLGLRSRPAIGFEIESTIRVKKIISLDEKVSAVWNKHGAGQAASADDKLYIGESWSLTLDLDAVTKIQHVEYVTKPLEFENEVDRVRLIRSITDIAALSTYYFTYTQHKQGAAGERMDLREMWIGFEHAMQSHQQRGWLEKRFGSSTLDLKKFNSGSMAYMVEGMDVTKLPKWSWQETKQVYLSAAVRGAPQATVDIPLRRVFRVLEALSLGSIPSVQLSGQPVALFRQENQAEALRGVVRRALHLEVTEEQRGLIAMMAFYVQVAALQNIRVTFCKEAYPILNRCGFSTWLYLVDANNTFRERLKGYLQQVVDIEIGAQKMIPEKWCNIASNQNPTRAEWVDSVVAGKNEKLMINTKKGWWPVKDNQLLTFELRGLPQAPVAEWRDLCVGIYDWFHELLATGGSPALLPSTAGLDEKLAPLPSHVPRRQGEEQPMRPVPLAPPPLRAAALPRIYYDMKDQDLLTQEQIHRVREMQAQNASHDAIARYLTRGGS